MNLESFSTIWSALAPGLVNHLWQSTLFAGAAGLLTLTLRKNHARARYWVWLAASLKFLIPFSLLVSLGSQLAWLRASGTNARLFFVIEEVVIAPAGSSTFLQSLSRLFPAVVAVVWLGGFLVILSLWCARWRRISVALRQAVPLEEGRESEALRRLERVAGIRKPVKLLSSRASLEPGIFGIARPALLWPRGISDRLGQEELEAILAHEVFHVIHRDNLAAALHMLVEAIFWFHPLVWWLGARLVEERERACDESVLELGSEPQIYAESILKVCEFCVESPLVCVSGITGADLKKRMVAIMNKGVARKLDFGRKLLLSVAGLLAIAGPIVVGLTGATPSHAQSQADNTPTKQAQPKVVQVSKDVMQGLLDKKVPPQYPEAAKKEGIQGKVVLDAIIGKAGDIEKLKVVTGRKELAAAAIEAVKDWKYKPYLLNGQPVEVETKVEVNFTLLQ